MLFGDASGSMSGTYFRCMIEGMVQLESAIFGDSEADNAFDEVHPIFWGCNVQPKVVTTK